MQMKNLLCKYNLVTFGIVLFAIVLYVCKVIIILSGTLLYVSFMIDACLVVLCYLILKRGIILLRKHSKREDALIENLCYKKRFTKHIGLAGEITLKDERSIFELINYVSHIEDFFESIGYEYDKEVDISSNKFE